MIQIRIIRDKNSYDFKLDKTKDSFENNIKNNMIDTILIVKDNIIVFKSKCQSVANYPGALKDTIKEGFFQIKCFVNNSFYNGEIHSIINAYDLDNQRINSEGYQIENNIKKGRWLIHDTFWPPSKKEFQYAYSAGCIMLRVKDMEMFNKCLKDLTIGANDILNGILMEV